jgi:putative SOS response-associated peptidase YedK
MHVPGETQFLKIFDGYQIGELGLQESWNLAPTQSVLVIRSIEGQRRASMMRWGLIPAWGNGAPPKYSTINARIETVKSNSCYKGPWRSGQRCIILAEGFYEWHRDEAGHTQPFYIKTVDQEIFGFAGLWERSHTEEGAAIESCTMITMPANRIMSEIHNSKVHSGKRIPLAPEERRMPAILLKDEWDAWLAGSNEQAEACLKQYPDDLMLAWPVSARVNTPKNNDAALIEPMSVQTEPSTGDLFR